ncbi:FAD-dependent oxidoreductase, partial [Enterobacter sp. DRP3]|nr:FAD-dependent oxidoreductase [Enterobacter sp. DRP3]
VSCCNAGPGGVLPAATAARIAPIASYIIATEPLGRARADALIARREAVCDNNFFLDYFRLSADHRMLFGGRANSAGASPAALAEAIRQRMVGVFPQLGDARVDHAWGGFVDVTRGRIALDGQDITHLKPNRRGLGIVFQSYALFPHMSVAENVGFGLDMRGVDKAERAERIRAALALVRLDALAHRFPRELSGGQRQRVAIGRAIVREPGVFLCDEPLSNLDAALRGQTRIEIARLHRQFERASVVYVTHDQTEAMTLADKIVLLHAGADTAQHGSI